VATLAAFFRKNYTIDRRRMRWRVDGKRLRTLSVDTKVLWYRQSHMFIYYCQMRRGSYFSELGLRVGKVI
jgi:hypothetical protein